MGPKTKFTREQIIDAAFEIAQREGIDSITMRKIAERMRSSVTPIYVNFKNVDELNEALMEMLTMKAHSGSKTKAEGLIKQER